MISAFNSDEDIHTNTAAQVFDMPPLFVTPEMRRKAKAVNFGIVYGIGAFSLSQDIGVSVAEADRYIKNYLDTFSGVRRYMEETVEFAQQHGYIETMFGRRRALPEIHSTNKNIVNFGKRVAMNTPIQGTAADIIKIAMIKVYRRLKAEQLSARLILQVHDELIVEAPLHGQAGQTPAGGRDAKCSTAFGAAQSRRRLRQKLAGCKIKAIITQKEEGSVIRCLPPPGLRVSESCHFKRADESPLQWNRMSK